MAILDKIYSNIGDWFEAPTVLPAITKSDHSSVIIVPSQQGPLRPRRQITDVCCRCSDPNGKATLCQCLRSLDWRPLFVYFPAVRHHGRLYLGLINHTPFCLTLGQVTSYSHGFRLRIPIATVHYKGQVAELIFCQMGWDRHGSQTLS